MFALAGEVRLGNDRDCRVRSRTATIWARRAGTRWRRRAGVRCGVVADDHRAAAGVVHGAGDAGPCGRHERRSTAAAGPVSGLVDAGTTAGTGAIAATSATAVRVAGRVPAAGTG